MKKTEHNSYDEIINERAKYEYDLERARELKQRQEELESKFKSKSDLTTRLERLEQRVKDLERNVGSAMYILKLVATSTLEASENYRNGFKHPMVTDKPDKIILIKSEILDQLEAGILVNDEDKETAERVKDFLRFEK